jgi:hypothetical protein
VFLGFFFTFLVPSKSEFCITTPFNFANENRPVWVIQGYIDVQCTATKCVKNCAPNSSGCNGTILSPTNVSTVRTGPVNFIPGNKNNIVAFINCSSDRLQCDYTTANNLLAVIVKPKSTEIVEQSAPNNVGTYSCITI